MDRLTTPASVPLLCDHVRSTRFTIGSCRDFATDGGELHGSLHFASDTQASDEAWSLAQQGHLRSVSVGYRVQDATYVPAGHTKTVKGKQYTGPVRVVTRWTLYEVSVVPIGADPRAGFRSLSIQQEDYSMSATPATQDDTRHLRLIDYCRSYVAGKGQRVPDDDRELLRSWASFDGLDNLTGKLGSWLLDGYNAAADSTVGWVASMPLPNYLGQRLATITQPVLPQKIGRGDTAPPAVLSSQYETWSLFKTGVSFQLDEQDILDSQDSLDTLAVAMREVGAGFRRVVLDAVWGLLLSNPQLADGVDLFDDATRGNLGTGVFATDAFSTAWTAIADATRATSVEGAAAHENLAPQYLVVSPSNIVNAVNIMSAISDAAPLVRVRSESRLSSTGFLDPRDDTIRSGNGDNWLLACPSSQAPSVILGFLGGRREPRFQSYELTQGQWGLGFDADLSLGVTAVSGNSVYWSSGTA